MAAPSTWVVRFASLIVSKGPVLDLAAGRGRHSRLLLDRGHPVVAVDRDVSGLQDLASRAGLEIVSANLESGPWPLAERRFDGVIVTNYLHRPLLPTVANAVAAGGVLIYETFARGNEAFGRPRNPEFLLAPDELLGVAREGGLAVTAFEQGLLSAADGNRVIQRLCAVRRDWPSPLAA